ncbi:MAG: Bacterial Ig-like domain {group 1 [Solirubrobacterales bacterium]|nr:Bacterial Ig-like domain {group 1 [Solirubrobacterales bacterium]
MPSRFKLLRRAAILGAALASLMALFGASTVYADGVAFKTGEVLAGAGRGTIKHFDPKGALLDTLDTTSGSAEDTGMCFDASGNLYATNFEANTMSKFDGSGNLVAASFGSGFETNPESCVFDAANNVYVGQADGEAKVLKFTASGELLASFAPPSGPRGTDWIDLAADQCTIHYTSEGTAIKAFNVCTNTQLPDIATGLPGPCYGHRILSDGSELVACSRVVEHVSATGEILHTYEPGGSILFALNLDPDGTSFWTADLGTGDIWRIDIASGEVLTHFNAEASVDVAGLTIVGELTCGTQQISLAPTTAEKPVGGTETLTATVIQCGAHKAGVPVTFNVGGVNPQTGSATTNTEGQATFTYTGNNAGTDHTLASYETVAKQTVTSNEATTVWTKATAPAPVLTPAPISAVLPAKESAAPKGTAHASSIHGCIAQTGYVASVSGTSIAAVTFTLDGHTIKTLHKPTSGATFTVRLNVRSGSAHHLAMRVVFTSTSKTPTTTFRRTLARCAAVHHVSLPRFTG